MVANRAAAAHFVAVAVARSGAARRRMRSSARVAVSVEWHVGGVASPRTKPHDARGVVPVLEDSSSRGGGFPMLW